MQDYFQPASNAGVFPFQPTKLKPISLTPSGDSLSSSDGLDWQNRRAPFLIP